MNSAVIIEALIYRPERNLQTHNFPVLGMTATPSYASVVLFFLAGCGIVSKVYS